MTPLDTPADGSLLHVFRRHFGLPDDGGPDGLARLAAAFACLPYENLTKILKHRDTRRPEVARRGPGEVVHDHVHHGAGGTCFSLTAALLHLVRAGGWRAEPILADRHYGVDTHCAILVWVEDRPHVIDPGYLITRPLPLDGETHTFENDYNRVILRPESTERVSVHTVQDGRDKKRLTYKTAPVDTGQFLHAWDASFGWDMMHYPLLSRVSPQGQHYIQDRRLQVRCGARHDVRRLSDEALAECIVTRFGMNAGLVSRALSALSKDEVHG